MRAELNFKYIGDQDKQFHYQLSNPKRVVSINHTEDVEVAIMDAEMSNDIVVVIMQYEASHLFDPLLKVKKSMRNDKHGDLIKLYYFDKDDASCFKQVNKEVTLEFEFMHDKATIIQQIEAIQDEIRLGNTYQVNYTTRLTAKNLESNLYSIYEKLSKQHGHYTAYIEDDTQTIVSISPELFFQYDLKSKDILTKPMKGTMPTSNDKAIDASNYQFLNQSVKDKAENVMIVDLLRNDLSKIAAKGSVAVPHLFTIERFLSVYQMTSTITANIGQYGLFDILKALFPCGSITGAPKQSTMGIINELEDTPRSIYCGTIGLIIPNEVAIFNVPIRTLEYQHCTDEIVYGVGGGITIDSIPELEYKEMIAKSNVLKYINDDREAKIDLEIPNDFHLIETMRVENGIIKRKEYHQRRLINALKHFKIQYQPDTLQSYFDRTFEMSQTIMYRVTVAQDGSVNTTTKALGETSSTGNLRQMKCITTDFHQYKTSVRSHYQTENLTLFHDGEHLLEFNIGNVVIERDGNYITPKHDYILEGCMRAALLDEGKLVEEEIRLELFIKEYKEHKIKVYMINSLREWVPVQLTL
ncbi:bifunctional chorismate-binding protein/class IV aminotransferase [Macrococcus sp. EM39E]|uniref:bifunctional chorismate-binding protein/class IV aminotransferase n=1 Tax=Macrococcus animalis TaxID=3395467 RepID=UPI0039BF0BB6